MQLRNAVVVHVHICRIRMGQHAYRRGRHLCASERKHGKRWIPAAQLTDILVIDALPEQFERHGFAVIPRIIDGGRCDYTDRKPSRGTRGGRGARTSE